MKKVLTALVALAPLAAQADCATPEMEMVMLALNIYHEARGEGPEGMQMVGEVTLNRAEARAWPDDICGVILQDWQFTWVRETSDPFPHETEAWFQSLDIARGLLEGRIERIYPTITHYYNPDKVEEPFWAAKYERVAEVGDHVFFHGES